MLHLRTRALFVTAMNEGSSMAARLEQISALRWSGSNSPAAFFRSLATMVRAGVPLQKSLRVSIDQCAAPALREALRSVLAEIESGRSLSDAMKTRPREFTPLFVAMIEAGEAGGLLDDVLERIATFVERDAALRKKVSAALAYPLVVMTVAVGLVFFLVATIVPIFGRLFEQLSVPLPPSTRMLLALGEATHWPAAWACTVAAVIAGASVYAGVRRRPEWAATVDHLRLAIPIFGAIHHKAVVARTTRILGSLLGAGVDVLHAIEVVAPAAGSGPVAMALREVHGALREGDSMAEPLARSRLFEPLVVQLVRVGEESGSLDRMLLKVAEYYEHDVDAAMATIGALLEPVLITGIGAVVGFIVFSIFIPLYTLIGAVK